MRILVYGGGFNPPHLGHLAALETARDALRPDLSLIVPDGMPPHKLLPALSPKPEERLKLCRLAFSGLEQTRVLDLAALRDGPCYMIDTVRLLRKTYPEDELILLLGADMLLSFDLWYRAGELLQQCSLAALCRREGERGALSVKARELEQQGGTILLLDHSPVDVSSSRLRELLSLRQGADLIPPEVYGEIIRLRLYDAKPDLTWLREQACALLRPKRVPHVLGCEETARRLALRWGYDADEAAEAALLHDMTKRWTTEEQLRYCGEKGIRLDEDERANPQLLHARTAAIAARELFGAPPAICDAIRWHTTGKPDMDLFETILYLADMIEPNRSYPGVEDLRELAERDLNLCMRDALLVSIQVIRQRGLKVYKDTLDACEWYCSAYRN